MNYIFMTVGLVLLFDGVVQLCVRKKTGPWKEGGASLLAGAIIAGVVLRDWLSWWFVLVAGLVLLFNGVVQLCVRKKTGPWREGGASLLAGAIIAGVSVFGVWLAENWIRWFFIFFLIVGLVLAFNGVVQLCVRKKTGPWKEGGASLLAGAIIYAGVLVFLAFFAGAKWLWFSDLLTVFGGFIIAGLVLAFNGVVQLCVRKKTGPWKEGGASLLAGAIGVLIAVLMPPPGL
jgi:predicted phage tail protein